MKDLAVKHTPASPAPASGRGQRWQRASGFAILGSMVIILYTFTAQQAWLVHLEGGVLVTVLLLIVLLALVQESRTLEQVRPRPLLSKPALLDFAGVVGGALATYGLSVDLELGAVTASGLIGLLGALLLPQQAVAIYCGSFAGMSSVQLLASYPELLLAGLAAGVVYILANGVLDGFGGKLGTIALTGTVAAGLGLRREFASAAVPTPPLAWHILIYATGAALLAYWLSVGFKHGPVIGSSVTGLIGGLLLPALEAETGSLLAVVVICASFTGMSSPSRIPGYLWMTVAGAMTGAIFIYSLPVFGGAGGKLGTIALGASLATWGFRKLLQYNAQLASRRSR